MTAAASRADVTRLVGFDTAGEPFVSGDRVLRGIYPGSAKTVRRVLHTCEKHNLFSHGIVATRELAENPHPELAYEIVLEHERIPFVSYPHEWSASMFKEAALLHIALYERLEEHGLTLKDWHPQNILFSATRPVFVDFTSIIPVEELPDQQHLRSGRPPRWFGALWDSTSKSVYEMYRLMFEPYFGLPLEMMHRGQHHRARPRIYETTLNASESVITRAEVFGDSLTPRLACELNERLLRFTLLERGPAKPRFFRRVRHHVASRRAALKGSAYSSYYEEKGEAFAAEPGEDWTKKQQGVHTALTTCSPQSVLDLGSNTGWFSMLAAKLGSSVVAVDLDEASIDRLFGEARRENLDILPLVANLASPLPPLYPREYEDEPPVSLIGGAAPVISSPVERLRCEMVIALAIVHHLALGQGHSFGDIAGMLDRLATRYLCVEFVDLNDAMITSDPGFFPAYNEEREAFGWYSKENFREALLAHFDSVHELASHPATRTLLVCQRALRQP